LRYPGINAARPGNDASFSGCSGLRNRTRIAYRPAAVRMRCAKKTLLVAPDNHNDQSQRGWRITLLLAAFLVIVLVRRRSSGSLAFGPRADLSHAIAVLIIAPASYLLPGPFKSVSFGDED
jgi:hypothetical protein